MALRSDGPVNFTLPPFKGVTRRLVLMGAVMFFVFAVLRSTPLFPSLVGWLALWPELVVRHPWQLVTYPFVPESLLGTLFALLSVWMFGWTLEDERGSRWLLEYFLVTTVGGGLLASLLALVGVFNLSHQVATGFWPFGTALILAFARSRPNETIRFNFILGMKAKYMAALYLLFYLGSALLGGDRLGATVTLSAALCGYLYLRFVPRRGLSYAGSEWWYGMRNAYYRARRRRAAKKFTVYMKKQGKDVSFDTSGRYVDPNDVPRDPNDRKWMN